MNTAKLIVALLGAAAYTSAWWAVFVFQFKSPPMGFLCLMLWIAILMGIVSVLVKFVVWIVEHWKDE